MRPRPYVRTWPYLLSCTLAAVRTCTCYVRASTTTHARLYNDTCAPLLRHVPFLARPGFITAACRQTDRPVCTYMFATRISMLRTFRSGGSRARHFLACEDLAGGSQQSGGKLFFAKYGGPSGGSLLSGGGIIILHVIRRHFLAAAVDPVVSLSTYSPRPMEVVP